MSFHGLNLGIGIGLGLNHNKALRCLRQAAKATPFPTTEVNKAMAQLVRDGFAYERLESRLKQMGFTAEQTAAALTATYPADPNV
jgi:hypothetical protein